MLKWFKRERATRREASPVAGRRAFFKAGAGAVAGGAALAAGQAQAETPRPLSPDAAGYRETEHVRRYYDSARM